MIADSIELVRTCRTSLATYGVILLFKDDSVIYRCKSLELPYKANKRNISCIPDGVYMAETLRNDEQLKDSRLKYPHIWIKDVIGRAGIKIHVANYVSELKGCIAPGLSFADIDKDGLIDVANSRKALQDMLNYLPLTGEFPFTIS